MSLPYVIVTATLPSPKSVPSVYNNGMATSSSLLFSNLHPQVHIQTLLNLCYKLKVLHYRRLRGLSMSKLYRPCDRLLLEKLVPAFADRGCHVVSVMNPYGHILGFLDSVPDPLLLRKSDSAGNQTRASGSVARNSDH
jgi:hypothetical protein